MNDEQGTVQDVPATEPQHHEVAMKKLLRRNSLNLLQRPQTPKAKHPQQYWHHFCEVRRG